MVKKQERLNCLAAASEPRESSAPSLHPALPGRAAATARTAKIYRLHTQKHVTTATSSSKRRVWQRWSVCATRRRRKVPAVFEPGRPRRVAIDGSAQRAGFRRPAVVGPDDYGLLRRRRQTANRKCFILYLTYRPLLCICIVFKSNIHCQFVQHTLFRRQQYSTGNPQI